DARAALVGRRAAVLGTAGGLGVRVHRGAHLLAGLGELLRRGLDRLGVVTLERLLQLGDAVLDLGLDVVGDLVLVLLQELLGLVDEALRLVAALHRLAALAVLLGVLLGIADHLVDVGLRQRGAAG